MKVKTWARKKGYLTPKLGSDQMSLTEKIARVREIMGNFKSEEARLDRIAVETEVRESLYGKLQHSHCQ